MKIQTLSYPLLAAILLSSSAQAAFDACLDSFPNRTPPRVSKSAGKVRDICFDGFAVLYSSTSKTPVFAAERLNRARLLDARDEQRTDNFYEEARLPSGDRAHLSDYKDSGYDRGHMAPAADMPSPNAMAQSFSLSNMVPQAPQNNRGIWAKSVEEATRKYAMRAAGDIFVFTGPVFAKPVKTIGTGRVWVPTTLYKLVYDPQSNRAWAFWVENRDDARMGQPIAYDELVRRVGIEFLPGIKVGGSVQKESPKEAAPVATKTAAVAQASTEGGACGSKRTCKQMASCAEARHYLADCGVSSLDRDGDGVPCESLCK